MSMIHLTAPPGFATTKGGLPSMRLPDEEEEVPWMAQLMLEGEEHSLEVRWWPKQATYMCRYVVDQNWEEPRELRNLAYPHEVVNWVGRWFKKLYQRALQVESPDE